MGVIVFIHVLSAVVWVGGMIAIKMAVHPAMQHITEERQRIARALDIMGGFFNIVAVFILLLLITAVLMIIGFDFKNASDFLYNITHVKEAIWVMMTVNFIYIYMIRRKAQEQFLKGDLLSAKQKLFKIQQYFIPFNIFLGLLAIYFGVTLRGF